MTTFYKDISQSRTELEAQGVDSGTTSDAVALITYVQKLKKQAKSGQEAVDQFKAAHRLLSQQRYQFPHQWLYAENVEGEWSSLTDILMRKDAAIQGQVGFFEGTVNINFRSTTCKQKFVKRTNWLKKEHWKHCRNGNVLSQWKARKDHKMR